MHQMFLLGRKKRGMRSYDLPMRSPVLLQVWWKLSAQEPRGVQATSYIIAIAIATATATTTALATVTKNCRLTITTSRKIIKRCKDKKIIIKRKSNDKSIEIYG